MTRTLAYMESPVGLLKLEGVAHSLGKISFVDKENEAECNVEYLDTAIRQLTEYFAGCREKFVLSIHLEGTHFQRNVWEELQKIPFAGKCCYEDIARKLGDIKVIRAAATANGRNPLPIIVPCHRVIGKNGSLTGYSGGLWRKKWLLDFEQKDLQPKLL